MENGREVEPRGARRAFYLPVIAVVTLLVSALVGAMALTSSTFLLSGVFSLSHHESSTIAQIGLKRAEDWLIASVRSGDVPLGRGVGTTPEERIAACNASGASVSWNESFAGLDVALYVADTEYGSGLFAPGTSGIPRIPESLSPGLRRRCYFLRSRVVETKTSFSLACEELLALDIEDSGKLARVTRLFYRTK